MVGVGEGNAGLCAIVGRCWCLREGRGFDDGATGSGALPSGLIQEIPLSEPRTVAHVQIAFKKADAIVMCGVNKENAGSSLIRPSAHQAYDSHGDKHLPAIIGERVSRQHGAFRSQSTAFRILSFSFGCRNTESERNGCSRAHTGENRIHIRTRNDLPRFDVCCKAHGLTANTFS